MRSRIGRFLRFLLFTSLLAAAALAALNVLVGRLPRAARLATIDQIYTYDPWNIYRLKPGLDVELPLGVYGPFAQRWARAGARYRVTTNANGFRGPAIPRERTPGVHRVAFAGDSSTFGWDVEEGEAFPAQVGARLSAMGLHVEVLNAGVPGYSTHQAIRYVEAEVLPYRPDVLVIAYTRNDEIDVTFNANPAARTRTDAELMPRDAGPGAFERILVPPSPDLAMRLRATNLYRFLREKILSRTRADADGAPAAAGEVMRRVPLAAYRANLETIAQGARAAGCRPVFVNVGSVTREYVEAMRTTAEALGAPFLDAWTLFDQRLAEMRESPRFAKERERYAALVGREVWDDPKNFWLVYSTDFGHPNVIGHAVIADALAPVVAGLLGEDASPDERGVDDEGRSL